MRWKFICFVHAAPGGLFRKHGVCIHSFADVSELPSNMFIYTSVIDDATNAPHVA